MNKKAMAVAVAGALVAPGVALAQTSTVQIGGSIHLIYAVQHDPNGGLANASSRGDILQTSEPEIYIRGEEQLGGGLSAWFQCTSSFDVVGTMNSGWCARNSGIGLKGNWGNVFAGTWDNPSKFVGNAVRGWWGYNNQFAGSGINFNTPPSDVNNTGAGFLRRQQRSWNYWSPSWNGLSFQGSYGPFTESTSTALSSPLKPRMYSIAGQYSSGPLYLGLGYERHEDFNPGGVAIGAGASAYSGGSDTNWIFGAAYTFAGVFKLSGWYTKNKYEVTNAGNMTKDGWALFADWTVQGPHSLKAQYVKNNNTKGSTSVTVATFNPAAPGVATGAKVWGLQYAYAFSKRSTGYLAYNKLNNDTGSAQSLGVTGASAGTSQSTWGLGFRHSF